MPHIEGIYIILLQMVFMYIGIHVICCSGVNRVLFMAVSCAPVDASCSDIDICCIDIIALAIVSMFVVGRPQMETAIYYQLLQC